eukprot:573349-Pyramimonas_sp.AAC.1
MPSTNPIVWCHAGQPGTETARPDLNEGKVRGGSSLFHAGEVAVASGTRSGKLGAGAVAVETHNAGDGFTTVSGKCPVHVDTFCVVLSPVRTSFDGTEPAVRRFILKLGLDRQVSAVLAAADLSIIAATVITKNKVIAIEKFKVVTINKGEALDEEQHAHLQTLLIHALESGNNGTSATSETAQHEVCVAMGCSVCQGMLFGHAKRVWVYGLCMPCNHSRSRCAHVWRVVAL